MLEPGTAQAYLDPFLLCQADLRTVSWLLTANDEASVTGALLDRVVTIEVGYPPPEVAPVILQTAVEEVLSELGWSDGAPALPARARDLLLRSFNSDGSTLGLIRRAVRAALGAVRCGDDPIAAVQVELSRGRVRDDRAYESTGRMGFIPAAKRET